jgi:hypothetical protein
VPRKNLVQAESGSVAGRRFGQRRIAECKTEVFEAELDEQPHVVRVLALSRLAKALPSVLKEILVAHDADLRIHNSDTVGLERFPLSLPQSFSTG